MTSDLAIEIKKLADKYRNNKKTGLLDSSDFGNDLNISEYKVSNSNGENKIDVVEEVSEVSDIDEFDYRKLDNLEKEIIDFDDLDISAEELEEEVVSDEKSEEIQIADFINPSINLVSDIKEREVEVEIEDFLQGDKRKVYDSLKIISRNLRDLKALLRS